MATSKFLRTFRTTAGAPITTAAIWLVPQANTYPTGALALTPHATRDGQYYRDNVPDGEYKIYIDPAGGSSPTLYEERLWVGDQRVSTISDNFDAADSYKLKSTGLQAQTKTVVSVTNPIPDYIGQPGVDSSGDKYEAIALTGTMWQKKFNKQSTETFGGAVFKNNHALPVISLTSGGTGVIKLTSSNNFLRMMFNIRIKIYEMEFGRGGSEIILGGYVIDTVNRVTRSTANIIGKLPSNRIRYGKDAAGKFCVLIGETTTVWNITYGILDSAFSIDFAGGSIQNAWTSELITSVAGISIHTEGDITAVDTQKNLDQYLDFGGSNQVSAADLKGGLSDIANQDTYITADAIQAMKLFNPALLFQGFANTSTATPGSHTLNHAWVVTETGTVFGIEAIKGQLIYDDGTNFITANYENTLYTKSNNLYDKSLGFSASTLVYDGVVSSNAGYNSTPFIPCDANKYISCNKEKSLSAISFRTVNSYDIDKNYISGTVVIGTTYLTPADTAFIRISFAQNYSEYSNYISATDFDTLQVQYGQVPTNYTPYNLSKKNIVSLETLEIGEATNILISDFVVLGRFLPSTNIDSANANYHLVNCYIPVSEGDELVLYQENVYQKIRFRTILSFDSNHQIIGANFVENIYSFKIVAGTSYVRFCFSKSDDTSKNYQLSFTGAPVIFDEPGPLISARFVSNQVNSRLRGLSVLAYGDSITANDEWLNFIAAYAGISKIRNIAIGGANITLQSTRTPAEPYDYLTCYPTVGSDTYNDRHLLPQIDHTPNTLRFKYDLISAEYLEGDGRYMYRPDIVLIFIGFNEWKNSGTLLFEDYADVKNLSVVQLQTRLDDAGVTENKTMTALRLAFEKLLGGEVTETIDDMTYGIDSRMAKFFFITPVQNANPYTYIDGGTAAHSKSLWEYGDYIAEILKDYSIKRIDGCGESGINYRYENVGSAGRYLADGIHPNIDGYRLIGKLISGQMFSNTFK